jgi:hypothetical protein
MIESKAIRRRESAAGRTTMKYRSGSNYRPGAADSAARPEPPTSPRPGAIAVMRRASRVRRHPSIRRLRRAIRRPRSTNRRALAILTGVRTRRWARTCWYIRPPRPEGGGLYLFGGMHEWRSDGIQSAFLNNGPAWLSPEIGTGRELHIRVPRTTQAQTLSSLGQIKAGGRSCAVFTGQTMTIAIVTALADCHSCFGQRRLDDADPRREQRSSRSDEFCPTYSPTAAHAFTGEPWNRVCVTLPSRPDAEAVPACLLFYFPDQAYP